MLARGSGCAGGGGGDRAPLRRNPHERGAPQWV